jgi:type VI secretion system protein VasD
MPRSIGSLVAAAFLLAGCSSIPFISKPSAPAPMRLNVKAADRLNPDDGGRSLPTLVRIYQLKSASKARTVELTDLLRDPKEALGEDLISTEELLLSPGQLVDKPLTREPEARAVLVAAVVRRPAGVSWRDVVELPQGKTKNLVYVLEEYRLTPR